MKKSRSSKLCVILLIAVIIVGSIPLSVNAYAETGTYEGFEYYKYDTGTVSIVKYEGTDTDVVVPATIKGYPVIYIASCAFYENTTVESVTLPEGLKTIDYAAFEKCTNLKSVNIPESVEFISCEAFDESGYYNDPANWDGGVFYVESALLYADPSISGMYTIKDGTTVIAEAAFEGRTGLTGIKFPKSLKHVGVDAFYECTAIDEVYIEDLAMWCGLDFDYYADNPLYYADKLYLNGDLVESLIIPDTVTVIEKNTFPLRRGTLATITDLIIPDSVTEIGEYAFYRCSGLERVYLGSGIKRLGSCAFEAQSDSLERVFYKGTVQDWGRISWSFDSKPVATYYYESFISPDCFVFQNEGDGDLRLVDYMGELDDVAIPAEYDGKTVSAVAEGAFSGRTDITSVEIPGTVECIEKSFLYECTALETIQIGEGVKEISEYAFYGCTALREIVISEGVQFIWSNAFLECTGLESVSLPTTLKGVAYKAFYRCENISDVLYNGSREMFKEIEIELGNHTVTNANIEYLVDGDVVFATIPVPDDFDPDRCVLYLVDDLGNSREVSAEYSNGGFLVYTQAPGCYVLASVVPGDLDGDGSVTGKDSNLLKRVVVGETELKETRSAMLTADINGDGQVNSVDTNLLRRMVAGM